MIFTLLAFSSLIISKPFSELGVYQSSKCKPIKQIGKVTTSEPMKELPVPIRHYFKAAHVFNTEFLDRTFSYIPAGFPLSITAQTCIPCLKKAKRKIISSCEITRKKVYPSGSMKLSMHIDTKKVDAQITAFEELNGEKRVFKGFGDVASNGIYFSAFLFSITGEKISRILSMQVKLIFERIMENTLNYWLYKVMHMQHMTWAV